MAKAVTKSHNSGPVADTGQVVQSDHSVQSAQVGRSRAFGSAARGRKPVGHAAIVAAVAGLMALSACTEREILLSGPREDLHAVTGDTAAQEAPPVNRAEPISLPAISANADWTQGAGSPATRTSNAALGANAQEIWAVSVGEGETRKSEITADPVVAAGRVFAMDAGASVTAVTPGGQTLWSRDLTPVQDRAGEASGGGLAYANGRLFVASGYGMLTALDPASGAVLWQQKLGASATGAPSAYGDLVYVTAGEEEGWAINQSDGRVQWQTSATPDINNLSGAPSPAVNDQYVIFGFGSGELRAAFRRGGLGIWAAPISGRREGFARSNISDITGDPVISGNTVFAGNQSGRMVALQLANGERLWTADEGPMNPVWPAGNSVFLLSDENKLIRLSASSGERIWAVDLPFFTGTKPKKQEQVYAHYGPILAGGRLVTASSDGLVRFFDPVSGALTRSLPIEGGAASAPVVAGGILYVVSRDGVLHAYR
ncbi:outer membrane protein assembly factor BamB family protein [Pseudooceanicola algae]|uniref:Outer membrane protein assembly factor BamB n=1 Tax=Pseudooceanicola algae TaxID=1537215 RepID=A0A418SC50_9RHOB|nr:PQQ-binding-like beta-propeller repeat protein [Pseudooceanicola algae]QPM89978.1 Outer membrane protein assembly factor BamB [Pseudooceanicola algae]